MTTKTNLGWVPLVLGLALGALGRRNEIGTEALLESFGFASVALVAWSAVLLARSRGRTLRQTFDLNPQHLMLALGWVAVLGYWGSHWEPIRLTSTLILGQLIFAYAFDMLLAWSRRDTYALGLAPAILVLSANVFMRFRDEWFYGQFILLSVGLLATELFRARDEGRRTHIFNPTCLALALVSIVLVITGTTGATWTADLAEFLRRPPMIYVVLFVVSLPVQFWMGVTTATLPAVLVTYGFSLLYVSLTGTYFFGDSTIPVAAFAGMLLLIADSATLPRTESGRIVFGGMYAAGVIFFHWLLSRLGAPTFYSVWLPVPLLNLMAGTFDRVTMTTRLSWLSPEKTGDPLPSGVRRVGYLFLWIAAFSLVLAAKGIGDYHRARTIPFWSEACSLGRPAACDKLAGMLERYCEGESGWACNELGIVVASGKARASVDPLTLFTRACGFGQREACDNRNALEAGERGFRHGDPSLLDFPMILRQGDWPVLERGELPLLTRGCAEGWMSACEGLAGLYFRGIAGAAVDKPRAASLSLRACDSGFARSCANLGLMHKNGEGVAKDPVRAIQYLKKSCDLGYEAGCRWLADEKGKQD